MRRIQSWAFVTVLLGWAFTACTGLFPDGKTLGTDVYVDSASEDSWGYPQTYLGLGPGETCTSDNDCRVGLACDPASSVCVVTGEVEEGIPCTLSQDCADGLVCSVNTENLDQPKTCVPEGDGERWDVCTTDGDCQRGYFCEIISFTGTCQPEGDGEVGESCDSARDCLAGLACGSDGKCGILGAQVPLFTGQNCEPSSQIGGDPRVLFEIPRSGSPLKDFYRLPFPNDLRVTEDGMDLSGHPTPGPGAVGFDVTARAINAMSEDLTAFGTNPVVFFRFSVSPDLGTINPSGGDDNVFLVDITSSAQGGYGRSVAINWVANTGRGLYICQNYLSVYVPWARPLDGNRTYAVILTNSIKAVPESEGEEPRDFVRDEDFEMLLKPTPPTEQEMVGAWEKYARLREFLGSGSAAALGVSKSNIIGATLFSTFSPADRMAKFKELIDTVDLPTVLSAVVCDDGVVSPCDDGLVGEEHKRGCFGPHEEFYEIQGKVRVPTFQEGTLPYIEPEDGGGVEWDALGRPVVKGFDEVCFSMTVPKGTAPAAGWPVVLYGHGTGGNYRSHITEGLAQQMNAISVWNPTTEAYDRTVKVAVMGWDQIMHGPRIGANPLDPDSIVFNFRNPRGALGNFYQAAAETMVLARMLSNWAGVVWPLADPPFALDPDSVIYFGHSQGGINGPLAIPFVDSVNEMIISGTGGGLVESLLRKSSPVDVRDGVVVALQDDNIGRTHPVLAMLQNYYDPVDPINYASLLFYEPYGGHKVRTFHPLGLQDTHTPPETMKSFSAATYGMLAASPGMAEGDFESFGGVQLVKTLPKSVTGGITVEYMPTSDYDGHFVIFHDPDAIRHYLNFVGTAILDMTPTLVN